MDAATKERMAQNEDVFRQINESIDAAALSHGNDEHRYEFFCECSDLACIERVNVTLEEYAHARADPSRFILVKGHVMHEVEHVVDAARDHVLVEKDGAAGRVAIELDEVD
jgi:hypothetical protein